MSPCFRRLLVPALALILLVCVRGSQAQTQSGISGTVTDSSGATLDGAHLEVRNTATGVLASALPAQRVAIRSPALFQAYTP